MHCARYSPTTTGYYASQPITAWKSKPLSIIALSQSASRSTKSTYLILLLCFGAPFNISIFDSKRKVQTLHFYKIFNCFAKIYPANYSVIEIIKQGKLLFKKNINFRNVIFPEYWAYREILMKALDYFSSRQRKGALVVQIFHFTRLL